jgi:hypothetical protein
MGKKLGWVRVLFIILILVRCGQGTQEQNQSSEKIPETTEKTKKILNNFPVLDPNGKLQSPRALIGGSNPLGVLLFIPGNDQGMGVCSLSHWGHGLVVTNAHCIESDYRPWNYYVIFYDKDDNRRYERVKKIHFLGKTGVIDIAVLKISEEASTHWDSVSTPIFDTTADIGKGPESNRKITLWSFDPLVGNHPKLQEVYKTGVMLRPKTCLASRKEPILKGHRPDENGEDQEISVGGQPETEKRHFFTDGCIEGKPVHGNSGSLITLQGDFTKPLAVFHSVSYAPDQYVLPNGYWEYTNLLGNSLRFSPSKSKPIELNGLASDLFYFVTNYPGVL